MEVLLWILVATFRSVVPIYRFYESKKCQFNKKCSRGGTDFKYVVLLTPSVSLHLVYRN